MQKKLPLINVLIIIFMGLLSTALAVLSGLATSQIPPAVTPYLRFTWPLLGIVTIALIGLTIWQTFRASQNVDNISGSWSQHQQQLLEGQNRQRMLEKVRAFWVRSVLEESLHGEALIALGMREQSDAVANPWKLVLQQPDQTEEQLPPDTRIIQIYDKAGGELLILGEPGSGKTTLLLELARDLLDRAGIDDTHPIPVVFNLSSWALKRPSISAWLIEELNSKYQVPRQLGQSWIDTNQVLPLLDGLDEVSSTYRTACVDAINAYRREHGIVPTVVCSRSTEYLTQAGRVLLQVAVVVQPLTAQQIDEFLSSAGGQLAAVSGALRQDVELRELAATPLMLSVLTLAYQDKSVEDILVGGSPQTRRRQVLEKYVERMLRPRSAKTRYTSKKIMHWLAWLAQQLAQNSQSEFYIERMQPEWLPDNHSSQLYFVMIAVLIIGLLGGIAGGLGGGLVGGLLGWIYHGTYGALLGGLFGGVLGAVLGGLFGGVLGAMLRGLFGGFLSNIGGRFFMSIMIRRMSGPGGGLLDTEIKPAEVIAWSWEGIWRRLVTSQGMRIGLLGGVLTGLTIGLVIGLHNGGYNGLISGILVILASWVLIGLYVVLQSGLSSNMLDQRHRINPNEGIWRSARNGLMIGLGVWFFGGWVVGLIVAFVVGPTVGLVGGLIAGLLAGVAGWLWGGGIACIKHAVLRLLLWQAMFMPLNYPRFLDYATERVLLRKVGGGYIFVHRLLQDYFASLDTTSALDEIKMHYPDNVSHE